MGTTVYVGLETDADNNSALDTATFDHTALLAGGNAAPQVAQAAAAATNPVTGTSVALSTVGSDTNGENYLIYTWAASSVPSGATAPTFSVNGTNAAKNTTATFSAAGSYTFQVTITNEYGLTITSSVAVSVSQTISELTVVPASPELLPSATDQMQAFYADQFGAAIPGRLAATWSVSPSTGAGTISAAGLYTAPATAHCGNDHRQLRRLQRHGHRSDRHAARLLEVRQLDNRFGHGRRQRHACRQPFLCHRRNRPGDRPQRHVASGQHVAESSTATR